MHVLSQAEPSDASLASLACAGAVAGQVGSTSMADPGAADAVLEEEECVVCWVAGPAVIFQPCGHLCTCSSCAQPFLAQSRACPMCRATITGGITVQL